MVPAAPAENENLSRNTSVTSDDNCTSPSTFLALTGVAADDRQSSSAATNSTAGNHVSTRPLLDRDGDDDGDDDDDDDDDGDDNDGDDDDDICAIIVAITSTCAANIFSRNVAIGEWSDTANKIKYKKRQDTSR
jgi:hypothetical protein